MIPSPRQLVSTLLLSAVPAAMIAAILAGNAQQTGTAAVYAAAAVMLAGASTFWSVAARLHRGAVIGAIDAGIAVLFGAWLFLASWTTTTGFGAQPDCVRAGFIGPPVYERSVFPTALWCTSADGTNRVLMTPLGENVGWTAAGAILIAVAVSLAIVSLIRRHPTSGRQARG